ncbi:MAG TPA: TIGR01777 family oxidoreductase, partial [Candidatus Binatia bacterium]|nr:TIGR01777 family oxidoreductase [Candidatus Binatia bacterium]
KIVISGATGFIGSILADRLWNQFHSLVLLSRKPPSEVGVSKKEWFAWNPPGGGPWEEAIDGADVVINLAGEPIAGKRWSKEQKEKLRSSRIDATRAIVRAIAKAKTKPRFLLNASAVGYYGAHGEETVTEATPAGSDFLSRLCVDWEAEALKAETHGVRVCRIRTGIVLDKGRGALAKMVPPFKMFVGGPLGSGKQYMPWIHIEDEIGLLLFLIEHESARGPFNATAPNPVTMEEFARSLGEALNRPSWVSVPPSALAILTGEMADMLLTGQRAVPDAATKLGYSFKYSTIGAALQSLRL